MLSGNGKGRHVAARFREARRKAKGLFYRKCMTARHRQNLCFAVLNTRSLRFATKCRVNARRTGRS
jgi:hypothetical protein